MRIPTPVKIAAATAAVVLLIGCSTSSGNEEGGANTVDDPYLAELYQAAVDAGESTLVGYVPDPAAYEALVDAFGNSFPGVDVQLDSLFGPELMARLEAEAITGEFKVDFTAVGEEALIQFADKGWLTPNVPKNTEGLNPEWIGPDNLWVPTGILPWGMVYSTDRVKEEDIPATFSELAQNDADLRLGINNPTVAGFPLITYAAQSEGIIDAAWVSELAKTDVSIYPSTNAALQALISGELDLAPVMPITNYWDAQAKGAPVGFAYYEESGAGTPALLDNIALFEDSPSPHLAKLWQAWLFTDEAVELNYQETGRPGVLPGSPQFGGASDFFFFRWNMVGEEFNAWLDVLRELE